MGGFGAVVRSSMKSKPHNNNCPNEKIANIVQKELDRYQEFMYDGFENAKSNEERIKYVDYACQARFWEEDMVADIRMGKCKGCDKVLEQYLMTPLYVICGVDERARGDKEITELLEPLSKIAENYSNRMESLMDRMEKQQEEADEEDSDNDSDNDSS